MTDYWKNYIAQKKPFRVGLAFLVAILALLACVTYLAGFPIHHSKFEKIKDDYEKLKKEAPSQK